MKITYLFRDGKKFERTVVINPVPSLSKYPSMLKEIYVEVKWKDDFGREVKYSVSTCISQK